MRTIVMVLLCLCSSAHAQDEPVPDSVYRQLQRTVIVRLRSGAEVTGRVVWVDAATISLAVVPTDEVVMLRRDEVIGLRALPPPWVPSGPSLPLDRERQGAQRMKRAGLGLMIAGGLSLAVVPVLWAVAVPVSNHYQSINVNADEPIGLYMMAALGTVAFASVGLELITMGAIIRRAGRGDELRLRAGPTGVAVTF